MEYKRRDPCSCCANSSDDCYGCPFDLFTGSGNSTCCNYACIHQRDDFCTIGVAGTCKSCSEYVIAEPEDDLDAEEFDND